MGRTKGAENKEVKLPEIVALEDEKKLGILADILLEIIFEEGDNAAAAQ